MDNRLAKDWFGHARICPLEECDTSGARSCKVPERIPPAGRERGPPSPGASARQAGPAPFDKLRAGASPTR